MIIEILKYGYMVLVAGAQVLVVGMFLVGFWNGFTYESGKPGSKYYMWFKLLPFKRFFKKNETIRYENEIWIRRTAGAVLKAYHDWMESDNCRVRYKNSLVDITDEVEIYTKGESTLRKLIQERLDDAGIIWTIPEE